MLWLFCVSPKCRRRFMHTPGPWLTRGTAGHEKHGQWAVYAESGRGRDIAIVYDGEANAALIAASPHMLQALEAAEMALEGHEDRTPDWHKLRRAAYRTVQEAIREAKGGA
jgi:hypothetical protein